MKLNVKSLKGLIATAETVFDKVKVLKSAGGQLMDRVQSLSSDTDSISSDAVTCVSAPAENTPPKNVAVTAAETNSSDIGSIVTLASGAQVALAIEAVTKITEEVGATIRYCEEQQTRREEIVQSANVRITEINRTTELIKEYLDKTFDERGQLFDKYFGILDTAIANGDLELMSQTLGNINSLAVSSPFKDLADINNVAKGLSEGTEWDI